MRKNVITLTEKARNRIENLLLSKSSARGIRVGVKKGGCSGLSYTFEYVYEPEISDEKVSVGNIDVYIDRKAVLYLIGTELDYFENKVESGFTFINPNEKASCGCGKSFNV